MAGTKQPRSADERDKKAVSIYAMEYLLSHQKESTNQFLMNETGGDIQSEIERRKHMQYANIYGILKD